jgi:hypothetical protein
MSLLYASLLKTVPDTFFFRGVDVFANSA